MRKNSGLTRQASGVENSGSVPLGDIIITNQRARQKQRSVMQSDPEGPGDVHVQLPPTFVSGLGLRTDGTEFAG